MPSPEDDLDDSLRRSIARRIRSHREARGWTLQELASRIGLRASRLSELERGAGSFSAEQFVLAARALQVPLSELAVGAQPDPEGDGDLQSALHRHGARHLLSDPGVLPTERYREPLPLVVAVLTHPRSDRWLAALAPVYVWSAESIPLPALWDRLAQAGVAARVGWFAQNLLEAAPATLALQPRSWSRRARHALAVASAFIENVSPPSPEAPLDPLLGRVLTPAAIARADAAASEASRRWRVASSLHPADFAASLREAAHAD